MPSRKRRKQVSGSPKREYDDEFFHLFLGIWFFILFVIFSPAFKVFMSYKPASVLHSLFLTGLVFNLVLRTVYLVIKKFEPNFESKVATEMKQVKDKPKSKSRDEGASPSK